MAEPPLLPPRTLLLPLLRPPLWLPFLPLLRSPWLLRMAPGSASPLARKTAAKLGVDYSNIAGSGSFGRITQKDILAAAEAQKNALLPLLPLLRPLPPPRPALWS